MRRDASARGIPAPEVEPMIVPEIDEEEEGEESGVVLNEKT